MPSFRTERYDVDTLLDTRVHPARKSRDDIATFSLRRERFTMGGCFDEVLDERSEGSYD
jgi:hypothetical protein